MWSETKLISCMEKQWGMSPRAHFTKRDWLWFNHMPSKKYGIKITDPFPNVSRCTLEVCHGISNNIQHSRDAIAYSCAE